MTSLYRDFEEAPDMEDNDEDIGALGSILSWDDDDNGPGAAGEASALTVANLRDRENRSVPPDTVQFSLKGGTADFTSFLRSQGLDGSVSGSSNDGNKLTFPLPMPTPVSDMENQQQQGQPMQQQQQSSSQPMNMNAAGLLQPQISQPIAQQQQSQPQQPQQQMLFNPQQQALAASFTQLLQQQAMQQQAQQQSGTQNSSQQPQFAQGAMSSLQALAVQQHQQQQQQQQQQQVAPAPAPTPMQLVQGTASQPQQQNPQSSMQQPQSSTSTAGSGVAMQMPFGDPNALIQQLQFAQLQQTLQASAQQAASQGNPNAAALQEQLRIQFAQAQNQAQQSQQNTTTSAQALNAPAPPTTTSSMDKPVMSKPPPAKKAKPNPPPRSSKPTPKKPPSSSRPDSSSRMSSQVVGFVSASDTDADGMEAGEATMKAPPPSSRKNKPEVDHADLTPEERAKANRDRNREHARNTRLRKKAYLEKLKATVDELCRERDTLVTERAGAANLLVEIHNTRTEVLMSFFALRSTFDRRRKLWSSILDESTFTCVMPVTPYRSFPASEVQVSKCQRTIMGIDGIMADTASLHVLVDSLVDRTKFPDGKIEFRYTLVTEEAVIAGNQMMARWVMTTTNAVACGAKMEVSKQGMLCCKFNSGHKIIGLELMFDVMAFMLQLKQAAGTENFTVIPNTVQTCQRTFEKPVVLTLAEPPYTIMQVNKMWEEMTGYVADDVVDKRSCSILQGRDTNRKVLEAMMEDIRHKRPASATLVNYKKSGAVFRNHILVYPLSTDSRVTHYLAITDHVDDGNPVAVGGQAPVSGQMHGGLPLPGNNAGQQQAPQVFPTQAYWNSTMMNLGNMQAVGGNGNKQVGFSQQQNTAGHQMPPPDGGQDGK